MREALFFVYFCYNQLVEINTVKRRFPMKKLAKKLALLGVVCISASTLAACSSNTTPKATARPTRLITSTPRSTPTSTPTKEPVPPFLSMLYDHYQQNAQTDGYCLFGQPGRDPIGTFEVALGLAEAPQANGKATVNVKRDSTSVEVEFTPSIFFGVEVCAPTLIKSVVKATVTAICNANKIDNANVVAENVLLSYDDKKYTSIIFAGDYAFVFSPCSPFDSAVTRFFAINTKEYKSNLSLGQYEEASYESFTAKINATSRFAIKANVKSVENGGYSNSYSSYKCIIITAEDASGNTIKIADYYEKVPVEIIPGKTYTFYGTSMFDNYNNPLLYLHYAE